MCNNWNNYWYEKILKDFGFKKEDDEKSADILNKKIIKKGKYNINNITLKDKCIIFAAGPSIKKHIHYIKKHYNLKNYTLIAADGTTTALLEEKIIPDIIVTDLDGKIENIIKANKQGSIIYLHAHGDNIKQIKKYTEKLDKIIPTTQTKKHGTLENHGGFTDGDRAVHIAVYGLKIQDITLAGMDYGNITTKYSRPDIKKQQQTADPLKKLKLQYAEKLVNEITKNTNAKIVNLTTKI